MNNKCSFARGLWNPEEWTLVKSPRWEHFGNWTQHDEFIANETPEVPDKAALRENSELACRTYTSMGLAKPVAGDFHLNVRMAFMDQMAPLVVFAPELGSDSKGRPEYRRHFEFVLYNKGINVWEHFHSPHDGPEWMLRSFLPVSVLPERVYTLGLELSGRRNHQSVKVFLDGQAKMTVGLNMGPSVYAGITGCEGQNRFYDFELSRKMGGKGII
jgi:hypothetical protein